MPLDLQELPALDLEPIDEQPEPSKTQPSRKNEPETKPQVSVPGTTFSNTDLVYGEKPIIGADVPLVSPEAVRVATELGGIGNIIRALPQKPRELAEGFRQGVEETVLGMTTPSSIAITPAFAIPFVGEGLALGLGAKAIGSGAGRTAGAVESGCLPPGR